MYDEECVAEDRGCTYVWILARQEEDWTKLSTKHMQDHSLGGHSASVQYREQHARESCG